MSPLRNFSLRLFAFFVAIQFSALMSQPDISRSTKHYTTPGQRLRRSES